MNDGTDDYDEELWDLERGPTKEAPSSAPPWCDTAIQIGIAFYRTAPTSPDGNREVGGGGGGNPLERRQGTKATTTNPWKRWVEDPLIRWFAKDMVYKHCEIAFTKDLIEGKPIPEGYVLAHGIIRDGALFGKYRTFSSDQYEWKWISVPQEGAKRMQQFCKNQMGKPYDAAAAKRSAFWPKACDYKKWYCTDFVVVALQQGGIMMGKNPRSQTTDDVYDIMCDQGNKVVRMSPYQRVMSRRGEADQDPSRTVRVERRK